VASSQPNTISVDNENMFVTGPPTCSIGGHTSNGRWRLSSSVVVVVCNTAGGRAGAPGGRAVERPTLHGGPVVLRPLFTGGMSFLSARKQCQSTKEKVAVAVAVAVRVSTRYRLHGPCSWPSKMTPCRQARPATRHVNLYWLLISLYAKSSA